MAYDTSYYVNALNKYKQDTEKEAETQKNKHTKTTADQLAKLYSTYRQNQVALPEQLLKSNITGGPTETANLKLLSDYENNKKSANDLLNDNLADIDTDKNSNISAYARQLESEKQSYIRSRQDEERQNRRSDWINTLSRYTSTKSVSKAIDKIRKTKTTDPNSYANNKYKILYLKDRLAQLKAEAATSRSSGGSSGRSSGRSSGGGNTYRDGKALAGNPINKKPQKKADLNTNHASVKKYTKYLNEVLTMKSTRSAKEYAGDLQKSAAISANQYAALISKINKKAIEARKASRRQNRSPRRHRR